MLIDVSWVSGASGLWLLSDPSKFDRLILPPSFFFDLKVDCSDGSVGKLC